MKSRQSEALLKKKNEGEKINFDKIKNELNNIETDFVYDDIQPRKKQE